MNSKLLFSFFLLFVKFSSSTSFNSIHKCSKQQSDALLVFKQNISSSNRSLEKDYYYPDNSMDTYCADLLGFGYGPLSLNWIASTDCCHWVGVTCNKFTGDVISLNLTCGMLQGVLELDRLLSTLPNLKVLDLSYNDFSVVTNNATNFINPNFQVLGLAYCKLTKFPEFLRAMKNIEILDLSGNYIRGQIPDWAGEIGGNRLLYLKLSNNFITSLSEFRSDGLKYLYMQSNLIRGPFPSLICNMNHLKHFDISNNRIDGTVPQCLENISSSVVSLNVHSNMIQGPFPAVMCNMSNLLYLDMSYNNFHGVLPECFGNITSSLALINLENNKFHGTIPNVYGDCGLSEGLILNRNQFDGEVPRSLFKCQSLKVLDLGNNQLNDTFPRWLGDLPKLQVLVLGSNNLHGTIEISSTMEFSFHSIRVFDISNNGFIGRLPGKYLENFYAIEDVEKDPMKNVNISGLYYSIIFPVTSFWNGFPNVLVELTVLDLSSNGFEGEILNIIGSLSSLIILNLSHNNLNGQIPHALGNLLRIEVLDLSWNQLTGEIPQSLENLSDLALLNLSQNHLVGRIPKRNQFLTFASDSFGGNLGLYGFPLPKHCKGITSPKVEADGDEESGFPWKVVMLGYGCGTVLGLLMGCRMLSTGRPKWFNAIVDAGEHMIPSRRNQRRYIYIGK